MPNATFSKEPCRHGLREAECATCSPPARPRGRPRRSTANPDLGDPRQDERNRRLRALAQNPSSKSLDRKKLREMWAAAIRVLRNEADADEVVSEIWRRYVDGKADYQWLARDAKLLAKDRAKERHRRRQREDAAPGALHIDVWSAHGGAPMDAATARIARLLHRAAHKVDGTHQYGVLDARLDAQKARSKVAPAAWEKLNELLGGRKRGRPNQRDAAEAHAAATTGLKAIGEATDRFYKGLGLPRKS